MPTFALLRRADICRRGTVSAGLRTDPAHLLAGCRLSRAGRPALADPVPLLPFPLGSLTTEPDTGAPVPQFTRNNTRPLRESLDNVP